VTEPIGSEAVANTDGGDDVCILIVDDEVNILNALRRLFRKEPFILVCAGSGPEALRVLRETERVALILSDQRMPGMNGSDFLQQSQALAPEATRMLLTGFADVQDTVRAMNEGGATRYVAKPWNDLELLQAVRDSVSRYRLLRENLRQQEVIRRQHEELQTWNANLKSRVMAQTTRIREQVEELQGLNQRLRSSYGGIIAALSGLMELRSPRSRRHSAHTAELAVSVAASLGLPEGERETIRTAALLHDIGKIAMTDVALATDEAQLGAEGQFRYYEHPVLGQTAIDMIEDLRPAGLLIRHHHERFDGGGFPDGLAGDAIPLGAAVIALADCFDREFELHVGGNALERTLEVLALQVGSRFAPGLFPHLAGAAWALQDSRSPRNLDELIEMEVGVADLRPGMIVLNDIFSRAGLFLLEAGAELDQTKIDTLTRIFRLNPLWQPFRVAYKKN